MDFSVKPTMVPPTRKKVRGVQGGKSGQVPFPIWYEKRKAHVSLSAEGTDINVCGQKLYLGPIPAPPGVDIGPQVFVGKVS